MSPEKYSDRIRSFVRRQGRLTRAQQHALEQYSPQFGLHLKDGMQSPEQIFKRQAPCTLEIGFGMGHSLLQNAIDNPDRDYIGVEVHTPGVGHLLTGIQEHQLKNIRLFSDDVIDVLDKTVPEHSIDTFQIFFPDPWPKKRHHKRRLVQADFLTRLSKKLKPQGCVHLATDWENYAEHMIDVLNAHPDFSNTATEGDFIARPASRPVTKFETRGLKKGHGIWDVLFSRSRT